MGVPQSPNPPHLYPQALQLKLYQAFIFSIPILFSIILFLLFYLFYLKRRASNTISSTPLPRPRRPRQTTTTYVSSTCLLDKLEIKEGLPKVLFDEELRQRDSQCCVCLGEFAMKEELLQVPSCKHVFHIDCIYLWLHTNATCPLCRCSVLSNSTKRHADRLEPVVPAISQSQNHQIHHTVALELAQQHVIRDQASASSSINVVITTEGVSSETANNTATNLLTNQGSVVIAIQI